MGLGLSQKFKLGRNFLTDFILSRARPRWTNFTEIRPIRDESQNLAPTPIKLLYWDSYVFFLALAIFQYLSFFFGGHQYFSHLPSKKGGDTTPPIPWKPSQLPLFSHIFSYTHVGPTFHMDIGRDILGYYCSISPNKSRKWHWATPIPSYWGVILGDCWRCSKGIVYQYKSVLIKFD